MYPVASSSSTTSTLTPWRDGKAASGTGELVAKLAPALKGADEPLVHRWLDNWHGVGLLAVGLHRTGYDLDLRQYGDGHWRATFYVTGIAHSILGGSAWERRGGRYNGQGGRRSSSKVLVSSPSSARIPRPYSIGGEGGTHLTPVSPSWANWTSTRSSTVKGRSQIGHLAPTSGPRDVRSGVRLEIFPAWSADQTFSLKRLVTCSFVALSATPQATAFV